MILGSHSRSSNATFSQLKRCGIANLVGNLFLFLCSINLKSVGVSSLRGRGRCISMIGRFVLQGCFDKWMVCVGSTLLGKFCGIEVKWTFSNRGDHSAGSRFPGIMPYPLLKLAA